MKTNTAPTGENCIRAALLETRHSMDAVFALVPSNAWFDRPVPERHPLLFYAGHVEAFDWNLIRSELHLQSFHPTFDRLFAFGIDPKAGQLPDDAPSDWPSIKEISDYTALVRRRIDEVVRHIPPVVPHIAMEHRLMHAETFTYLLHNLPPPICAPPCQDAAAVSSSCKMNTDDEIMTIPSGTATLGRYGGSDNEPGIALEP